MNLDSKCKVPTALRRRALLAVLASAAAAGAMAQTSRPAPGGLPTDPRPPVGPLGPIKGIKPVTLPCCRCLGEPTVPVNISTGQIVPHPVAWTVNGSPVVLVSPTPGWASSAPAQWVGPSGTAQPGTYTYELKIVVPKCIIPGTIIVKGQFWADNQGTVSLTGLNAPGTVFATAGGIYGFTQANAGNFAFTVPNAAGVYVLKVVTTNEGGPTGLLLNAMVVKRCATEPRGPAEVEPSASSPN